LRKSKLRGRPKKTSAQNREKLTPPPLFAKLPHWFKPPLSVRTHHKYRKINSFFASKSADVCIWRIPASPFSAKYPYWTTTPLWLQTSFMHSP